MDKTEDKAEMMFADIVLSGCSPAKPVSKPPTDAEGVLTIAVKRVGNGDTPYVTLENVNPDTTVQELKDKIYFRSISSEVAVSAARQPILAERQRLIYAGRMLTDDDETLGNEGVKMKPGDVNFVHLVPIPEGKKLSYRNRNENKGGKKSAATPATNRRIHPREGSSVGQRRRARLDAAGPYSRPLAAPSSGVARSAARFAQSEPTTGSATGAPSRTFAASASTSNRGADVSAAYISNRLLELSRAQEYESEINELEASPALTLGIANHIAALQQRSLAAEAIQQSTQIESAPGQSNNNCSVGVMDDVARLSQESMPLHECLAPALRTVNEILANEARHFQRRNVGFPPSFVPTIRPPGQQAQISSALHDVADLLDQSSRQSLQLAQLLRSINVGTNPGQVRYLNNGISLRQSPPASSFERALPPTVAGVSPMLPTGNQVAAAAGNAFAGSISDILAAPGSNRGCEVDTVDFLSTLACFL